MEFIIANTTTTTTTTNIETDCSFLLNFRAAEQIKRINENYLKRLIGLI